MAVDAEMPQMLDLLDEATRNRRTPEMELLRVVAQQTNAVFRQLYVTAGGETPPDPLDLRLPGDPPPTKRSPMRDAARRAMRGMRGK